jgi:hypothetical protein
MDTIAIINGVNRGMIANDIAIAIKNKHNPGINTSISSIVLFDLIYVSVSVSASASFKSCQ